jgi:hypothetical protein
VSKTIAIANGATDNELHSVVWDEEFPG